MGLRLNVLHFVACCFFPLIFSAVAFECIQCDLSKECAEEQNSSTSTAKKIQCDTGTCMTLAHEVVNEELMGCKKVTFRASRGCSAKALLGNDCVDHNMKKTNIYSRTCYCTSSLCNTGFACYNKDCAPMVKLIANCTAVQGWTVPSGLFQAFAILCPIFLTQWLCTLLNSVS